MAQDNVDIIVNNKTHIGVDRKKALGFLISLSINHLKYMPTDAIKNWILSSCELVEETFDWKGNATLRKQVKYIRDHFVKNTDIDNVTMQGIAMNIILSSEGLGLWAGFNQKRM